MRVGGGGNSETSQPNYGHGEEESVLNQVYVTQYPITN